MNDLVARREARRRKILENSENRLKRITGVEQKSDISIDGLSNNKSVSIPDELACQNQDTHLLNHIDVEVKSTPSPANNILRNLQEESLKSKSSFSLVQHRISIITLIACVYSCFLSIVQRYEGPLGLNFKDLHLNKIFIPLLLYEVINFMYCPPPSESFLQRIILASSQNNVVMSYVKYVGYLMKLMKDVMIYFVIFIICYYIFEII